MDMREARREAHLIAEGLLLQFDGQTFDPSLSEEDAERVSRAIRALADEHGRKARRSHR